MKTKDIAIIAAAGVGLYMLFQISKGIGTGIANFFSNPVAALENGAWDMLTGGQWSQYQKELAEYNAKVAAMEQARKEQEQALNDAIELAAKGNVFGAIAAYKASVQYRIEALKNSPAGITSEDEQIINAQAEMGIERISREAQISSGLWTSSKEQEYIQAEINSALKDLDYYRNMYTAGRMDYNSWASLNSAITAQIDSFKAALQAAGSSSSPSVVETPAITTAETPGNISSIYNNQVVSTTVITPGLVQINGDPVNFAHESYTASLSQDGSWISEVAGARSVGKMDLTKYSRIDFYLGDSKIGSILPGNSFCYGMNIINEGISVIYMYAVPRGI